MVGHCAKVEVVELKGEGKLPAHLMMEGGIKRFGLYN